jgi:predicted ATPase/5S rRNA maturation endonuclease (ribonuclease M5)
MKHRYIEIQNYRGIEHIRLEFTAQPRAKVYTLVGLNESGKTTILEAINSVVSNTESLNSLDLPGYIVRDAHELIPISKRSNFNGEIKVTVGYGVDEDDQVAVKDYVRAYHNFELSEDIQDFEIKQIYKFENSRLKDDMPQVIWHLPLVGKKKGRRRIEKLETGEWKKAVTFVKTLTPSILYFPNFLFDFPDKIYLESVPNDEAKHAYYRTILQDVLDAIGDGTNLETHVLSRAKSGTPHNKQALESVLLKMGANITKTVFKNWNRIFKRRVGDKEIRVDYGQDGEGRWYIQLRLKDGSELYSISERSLGFRWFFTFLLLTQYRGFRKGTAKSVLFLLDEPASNLHPSAQAQLLDSFGSFPPNCSIIYTTHSHHMINPAWLEGTYVVKNEGLDYQDEEDSFSAQKTIITLQKYREFAAQHPEQSTYFQPILDVLDYNPGKLENVPNVVMVEGKNDYYTLKYFFEKILNTSDRVNLMPGGGSGSLDDMIRLYLGWGRNFIVLLDADESGVEQKRRYESLFGDIVKEKIFTLGDISSHWKKELENLITDADRLVIQQTSYPAATKYKKTHFNRAIQELFLTDNRVAISHTTTNNFSKLHQFFLERLK